MIRRITAAITMLWLAAVALVVVVPDVVVAQTSAPAPVTFCKDVAPLLQKNCFTVPRTPKATVYYGDQTWEEMHFPSYGVVVDDITLAQRDVVAAGGFIGGGAPPPATAGAAAIR